MNAQLLKKLFRAIGEGSEPALDKVAIEIVQDERRRGHSRLASDLERVLHNRKRPARTSRASSPIRELRPLSASRELLVSIAAPEGLAHHMVLAPDIEARFQRIENEFAARERLALYGLQPRRRILLHGPPGCGKTLAASRLAWTTGMPLMKVRFDSLISSLFGETASNLRKVFEHASQQPTVLLLDECDYIARSRLERRDIGEISRVVNTLLQLLEDFCGPGLVVATTNIDSALDTALFRRFDDAFLVPLPGKPEIVQLLQTSLSSMELSPMVVLEEVAATMLGSSSADVVRVAHDTVKRAVLDGSELVKSEYLKAALGESRDRTN